MLDIFSSIYLANTWGSAETRSGPGSEKLATLELAQELQATFARLCVDSLLDCPCGQFGWIENALLPNMDYHGIDIVPQVVDLNRARYPQGSFDCLNMSVDALPRSDLILCRDALVHLSNADIAAVMNNFARSGSTFLLTTQFDVERNVNIATGGWRPVNLTLPPFNLKGPLAQILDRSDPAHLDKKLCLWSISDLVQEEGS